MLTKSLDEEIRQTYELKYCKKQKLMFKHNHLHLLSYGIFSMLLSFSHILGLIGGAWIYGQVDDNGGFTGHNVTYINQDFKTIFVGAFNNGLMVRIHMPIYL